jgi:sugar lactone lactonase YvrE
MAQIAAHLSGCAFLEGPRWHEGALYVSDMHGDAVLRVTEDGDVSTVVALNTLRAWVGFPTGPCSSRQWPGGA